MRPVQGLIGSTDTSARRLGRRDGETFDARRRSCRIVHHLTSVVDGEQPTICSIDERRDLEPVGLGIDFGVNNDHHDTSGQDAGRVPVTRPSFSCRGKVCHELGGGRLRKAGKASESFPVAWYPLSTYPWDPGAKSSHTSEQLALWLSGYQCGVQHDRRLQGCSAELVAGTVPLCSSLRTIVIHT